MSFVITLECKLIHNCRAKGLCIEIAHNFATVGTHTKTKTKSEDD